MVKKGNKALDFKAQALVKGEEKTISLKEFRGKKVALYFYPRDLTPGCTTQACNLRDNYKELKKNNIEIIGVSKDSIKSHIKFAEKKELPFILIADEDKKINEAYGVWQEKSFMGRKFMGTLRQTFLIDENGEIVNIIEKPVVGGHAGEIIDGFKTI